MVLQFLLDCYRANRLPQDNRPINAYVLEGGSGCCKFGWAFIKHLLGMISALALQKILRPCVVLTDLSMDVLVSRQEHPDFQTLLAVFPGQIEFAILDVDIMVTIYMYIVLRNNRGYP